MPNARQIRGTLEFGESLQLITQSLAEIASNNLRRIRSDAETNIKFFNDILEVYHQVKLAAAQKGVTVTRKNNKTLSILLTSNFRLYGDLNDRLIRLFLTSNEKTSSDWLVIGQTGVSFLKSAATTHSYTPVLFTQDKPKPEELKALMATIAPYQKVLVFHSRFKSVLRQDPFITDITQTPTSKEVPKSSSYIFEPEIERILNFFETQIATLLMEETLLESELCRVAARLISMDQAQANAVSFIKDQKKALANTRRLTLNNFILETTAALTAGKELINETR